MREIVKVLFFQIVSSLSVCSEVCYKNLLRLCNRLKVNEARAKYVQTCRMHDQFSFGRVSP